MNCKKCNTTLWLHRHHVTYIPERLEYLCGFCHGLVTSLNTHMARRLKRKLPNELREIIFDFFIQVPLKKRSTKKLLKKQVVNYINRYRNNQYLQSLVGA